VSRGHHTQVSSPLRTTVRRGTLPFTGFALWLALLAALGLLGTGLILRSRVLEKGVVIG
jgi:hypothetical protein